MISLCSGKWFKKSLFICLDIMNRKENKEEENSLRDSVPKSTFCGLGLKAWAATEKGFQVKT